MDKEQVKLGVQVCKIDNFDGNMVTFKMPEGARWGAGEYAIIPEDELRDLIAESEARGAGAMLDKIRAVMNATNGCITDSGWQSATNCINGPWEPDTQAYTDKIRGEALEEAREVIKFVKCIKWDQDEPGPCGECWFCELKRVLEKG